MTYPYNETFWGLQGNEVLIQATAGMDPGNTMLHKRSLSQQKYELACDCISTKYPRWTNLQRQRVEELD